MSYFLIALMALVYVSIVGTLVYLELQSRRFERAETAAFSAMTLPELADALAAARVERDADFHVYTEALGRWRSYKWGYRRNPHFGRYVVAQSLYARSCRRVAKLEALIQERSHGE